MADRHRGSAMTTRKTTTEGRQLAAIESFPVLPDTLDSTLVNDLRSLGFVGAESFVRGHDPELIRSIIDDVAPVGQYARFVQGGQPTRKPRADLKIKNVGGLIRWLVKEAEGQ